MFQAERAEHMPWQDEVGGRQPDDAGPPGHVQDFDFYP